MVWTLVFVLWFLGTYVAALGFSSTFDHWGRSKISTAIVVWPLTILVLLIIALMVSAGRGVRVFVSEWRDRE